MWYVSMIGTDPRRSNRLDWPSTPMTIVSRLESLGKPPLV